MRRGGRFRAGGILALAAALVTGCATGGASGSGSSAAAASTITITEGTRTAVRSIALTPEPGMAPGADPTAAAPAPPATDEPAPVAGTCPYLSDDTVADINGQRTGVTTVIAVSPHPICTFTRTDGGWLATVRIVQADSPAAAAAAVDQHVPVDASNPADDPAGWTGGSMATGDGSVYAVAKGSVAVIAEANQPQSIKGRQLAVNAIANLGL